MDHFEDFFFLFSYFPFFSSFLFGGVIVPAMAFALWIKRRKSTEYICNINRQKKCKPRNFHLFPQYSVG